MNASDSGSDKQGSGPPVAGEPDLNGLGVVRAVPKRGNEPFQLDGKPMDFDLLAYWRWAASDLLNNTSRGNLAEFIVARALGVPAPLRATWEEYDLATADGVRIEVKSSAYIQGWGQARHSKPRFGINPSRKWEKEHAGRAEQAARHSDVYVFALLHHMQQKTVDPTDLAQWTFYVLPTSTLDSKCPGQKTIGLGTLAALGARKAGYGDLRDAVAEASAAAPGAVPAAERVSAAKGRRG